MSTWNPQLMRLRQQLARISLTPDTLQERAAAALAVPGPLLPHDPARLAPRAPGLHRHPPLPTAGPTDALRRYFQTPEADAEVEQLGLNRRRPPMLASEIPVPLHELR